MRITIPLILAAAVAASSPALAQDANNTAVADTNASAPVAPDANATAPAATDMNATTTTTTEPVATDTTEPAPSPEKKGGFPWGVIGLLGLIGLIPRKAR